MKKEARIPQSKHRLMLWGLVLVCVAMSLLMLSGCKYSDVLTQHTEDPDLGAVDESVEPTYESNPDAEFILDLAELSVDDEADDENTQVEALPHYDPAAPDNGPTKQRIKSPETPHDEEASEGEQQEEEQEPDRKGKGEGDQGGGEEEDAVTGDNDKGENESENEESEELTSDEAEEPSDEPNDGGAGGTTVVVDDGTTEDTAKGTVAAVGEYATIAQMLGGAGALAAADEDWLAARAADGCFEGELEHVQVAFTGSGDAEGSCDVDALINTIQPSVVLWDGTTPNLSEADREALEAAGIAVQIVPTLGEQTTEDYAITQAVSAVASVLSGASGISYDPIDVANRYVEFHDKVLQAAYDANSGYSYKVTDGSYDQLYQNTPLSGLSDSTTTRVTTVFVDSLMWPSVTTALVSQTAATSDGVIRLAHDGQSLDVTDGVALSAATNVNAYMLIDYYLQLAGVMNNAYDTALPEAVGRRYILMPGNTSSFGVSSIYASRTSGSALFYNGGDGTVKANWHALGNSDFPAMLAANDEIAQALYASAEKANGLYRMDDPYRIIVVPSGVAGSWAEGHIDSHLMALWSYGIKDASNLSTAAEWAGTFYKDYLRCSNWESAVANWDTSYTTTSG